MPGHFGDGHNQREDRKDEPGPANRLQCEPWLAADDKEASGEGRPERDGSAKQLCGWAEKTEHKAIPGAHGKDSRNQCQQRRKFELPLHLPLKGVALRARYISHSRGCSHSLPAKEADCVPIPMRFRGPVGRCPCPNRSFPMKISTTTSIS